MCVLKKAGEGGASKLKIAVNSIDSYSSEKQYVSNIAQLDKVRLEWEATHISTCEVKLSARIGWIYQERNPRCVDGVLKCTDLDQHWQYPRPVLSYFLWADYKLSHSWSVSGLHFHVEYPQQKSVSNFMYYVFYLQKKRLIGEKKKIYSPFYFTLFITGNPSYPQPTLFGCLLAVNQF